MSNSRKRLLGIACVSLCTALSAGCEDLETEPSGSGTTSVPTTTTTDGAGGEAGQGGGQAGSGGEAGQGGAGGQGGQGGSPPQSSAVTEWASAGGVTKSSKFTMIYTMGQATTNVGKSSSSSYHIKGAPIGDNGSDQ